MFCPPKKTANPKSVNLTIDISYNVCNYLHSPSLRVLFFI